MRRGKAPLVLEELRPRVADLVDLKWAVERGGALHLFGVYAYQRGADEPPFRLTLADGTWEQQALDESFRPFFRPRSMPRGDFKKSGGEPLVVSTHSAAG